MNDTMLDCPACGHPIALTAALAARVRAEVEAEAAAERRRELAQAIEKARVETAAALRRELAQAEAAARQAREAGALELQQLRAQLADRQAQLADAQQAELALRRRADELQQREGALELALERRIEARREQWQQQWGALHDQEQALKLREKERLIDELRGVIDELRRKSRQGSQQHQGETLELDLEAALAARFPHDRLQPVAKGAPGADLIQHVRDAALADCGRICWEIKSTRHWQPAWLAKLRDDQRACGAAVAVLVSAALPEGAASTGFARIDGVWVCGLAAWPALAAALREQLLQVAFARNAATGMDERMQALHRYLAGDAFRHKVEAIVEAFTALQEQLGRERRAMERLWKERERQLDRIIGSTAGMYGELRGTIGGAMGAIAALELEGGVADPAVALAGPAE